jgi:hypothetical protein
LRINRPVADILRPPLMTHCRRILGRLHPSRHRITELAMRVEAGQAAETPETLNTPGITDDADVSRNYLNEIVMAQAQLRELESHDEKKKS